MKLVNVGLIDRNRALTVDDTSDDGVGVSFVLGGGSTLAIAEEVISAEHSLILWIETATAHVGCRLHSGIHPGALSIIRR